MRLVPHLALPYATFVVNIVGCFIIGVLAGLLAAGRLTMSADARALVFVGILGGFTTFSTFGLDTIALLHTGAHSTPSGTSAGRSFSDCWPCTSGCWRANASVAQNYGVVTRPSHAGHSASIACHHARNPLRPFHLAAQTLTGAMQRICAEYDEMPGLRLTAAQAARLLALHGRTCESVLNALEETGYLRRSHGGFFVRAR